MVEQSKLVLSKQWFIDSHQGNIKDVYHFVERLGSGGFGVVYLAEHRVTSKKLSVLYNYLEHKYAVKAIQKSRVRDYETF